MMLKHGDRCECRLLAEAVGLKPGAIGFAYCRAVLKKHWTLECNHGCPDEPPLASSGEKWHDVGPLDPVKAILIKNG